MSARTILIAGPTASGKSSAALALSAATGAEIVNADSMQVYRDLCIVTARPSQADERAAPHHLYGTVDGAATWSAGRWARSAAEVIAQIHARARDAIIVGGTGFYFRALEEGLSPIPETPPAIRQQAAARRAALGPAAFREETLARDPAMAHLPESDAQRLSRAWEVFEATGKPLSAFQNEPREPLIDGDIARVVIDPPRDALYAKCDRRAATMIETGAVDEVETLLSRRLDPLLPVMRALGVAEISAYLTGDTPLAEATETLQQNTRRFAKRQLTWFRNQTADWPRARAPEGVPDAITQQIENR